MFLDSIVVIYLNQTYNLISGRVNLTPLFVLVGEDSIPCKGSETILELNI